MPQLFGYLLTGAAATEPTIASTGGFFANGAFDKNFVRGEAGVPAEIFPPVRKTFENVGVLNEASKALAGISYDVPVILTPGHDTACAVLCCRQAEHPLYLSSGTWSLFGTTEDKPVIADPPFSASTPTSWAGTERCVSCATSWECGSFRNAAPMGRGRADARLSRNRAACGRCKGFRRGHRRKRGMLLFSRENGG